MPTEFTQQPSGGSSHATRLVMIYDGSGRRISKTAMRKVGGGDWDTTLVTHYTGIGTEVREYKPTNFARYTDSAGVEHCVSADPDYGGNASTTCPLPDTVKVAVSLPRGLGRYALQDAATVDSSLQGAYEFYLKDHLGSTRMVYGVGYPDPLGLSPQGDVRAAYDYRSFGEQLDLLVFTRKVTENFTGKERDDETGLSYHEARYLDPMLGVWISVDPKGFFLSPYLYMGNGYNPIRFADLNGQEPGDVYVFNSDGQKFGNFIAKLHRGQGPGFSHAAIETKDGRLFSADEDGVGVKDKSIALKGRTGVILRPKQKLNIDAMQKFIDDAQGGVYLVDGVCSSNVVDALEAGGLKLREDWTRLELIKDPSRIKKTVPHPAVLLEYPELEQIDYFREEPNDLKDAN